MFGGNGHSTFEVQPLGFGSGKGTSISAILPHTSASTLLTGFALVYQRKKEIIRLCLMTQINSICDVLTSFKSDSDRCVRATF